MPAFRGYTVRVHPSGRLHRWEVWAGGDLIAFDLSTSASRAGIAAAAWVKTRTELDKAAGARELAERVLNGPRE